MLVIIGKNLVEILHVMEEPVCTSAVSNISFTAIKDFVKDLVSVFGTGEGKTPLGFYNRLISHIEDKNSTQGIERYVCGFKNFFDNYSEKLESNTTLLTIPRGVTITYKDSDRVYLEIQKFIHKSRSSPDQLDIIRSHLLTIHACIKKDDESLLALTKSVKTLDISNKTLDISGCTQDSTPTIANETKFIGNQMDKIAQVLEEQGVDTSDPMSSIMALANSGIILNMVNDLKNGVESGQLNPENMLPSLQASLANMMGQVGGDVQVGMEEINMMTAQFMMNQNFVDMVEQNGVNTVEEVD